MINRLRKSADCVLRLGMAAVFLWFSFEQFLHPESWTGYVPDSIVSLTHLDASTLVLGNALFELVFGLMLAFGLFTRVAALLLALHLFDIMWMVGFGQVATRDFGLALATLVVFMNGSDPYCVWPAAAIGEGREAASPVVDRPSA